MAKYENKKIANGIIATALILIGMLGLLSSIVVIDAGQTGVKTRFGKLVTKEGEYIAPGFHLKVPFIERISKYSVRSEQYTMGSGDTVQALTSEGLNLEKLDITVRYHQEANASHDVYQRLGPGREAKLRKLIRPTIRSAIRSSTSKYEVQEIYGEKREELAQSIKEMIQKEFDNYGFVVESVQIRNIMLPNKVRDAIQKKQAAQQEIKQKEFEVEVAKKEAERRKEEAEGIREAQDIIQETLTRNYLRYLWVKEGLQKGDTIYVPIGQNGLPIYKDVDSEIGQKYNLDEVNRNE